MKREVIVGIIDGELTKEERRNFKRRIPVTDCVFG